MSKSYNLRNKDNTDNLYLKHYFASSSFRGKNEDMNRFEKRMCQKLKNKHSGIWDVPKSFKKQYKKKEKEEYEKHLRKCLKNGDYDAILTPVVKKNHRYDYF